MVRAGNGGSIVNMSSIMAAHGAPNLVAYSASKGAISAMTRSMAIALAELDLRQYMDLDRSMDARPVRR